MFNSVVTKYCAADLSADQSPRGECFGGSSIFRNISSAHIWWPPTKYFKHHLYSIDVFYIDVFRIDPALSGLTAGRIYEIKKLT
jgi:hypothetical protein